MLCAAWDCGDMRIISGSLRGKKLHGIRGMAIRPTADRLRESVFNIISAYVRDAVVLDMFAGTGALGIEALSRGASSAAFVDNSPRSLSVIERNLRSCALENRARIIRWDIRRRLSPLTASASRFDLVFMDPPYNRNLIEPALRNLRSSQALQKDALVVVEHSLSEAIPKALAMPDSAPNAQTSVQQPFAITDQRKYGNTLVSFLEYRCNEISDKGQ